MYGGAERTRGVLHALFQGPEINHFSYYRRPEIVRAIAARLSTDEPGAPWARAAPASPTMR